jgi:hypothetical protein
MSTNTDVTKKANGPIPRNFGSQIGGHERTRKNLRKREVRVGSMGAPHPIIGVRSTAFAGERIFFIHHSEMIRWGIG